MALHYLLSRVLPRWRLADRMHAAVQAAVEMSADDRAAWRAGRRSLHDALARCAAHSMPGTPAGALGVAGGVAQRLDRAWDPKETWRTVRCSDTGQPEQSRGEAEDGGDAEDA